MALSTMVIAAVALLFGSGPIVADHQAYAAAAMGGTMGGTMTGVGHGHSGHYYYHGHYYRHYFNGHYY